MKNAGRAKKWSGARVRERHELAAERRHIRKEPSSAKRRILELALSRKIIDPKFLAKEPSLTETRWVEYGYLSPLECTERFTRTYLELFRHFHEKYVNYATAAKQKPVDPDLFMNDPGEISSLWRARQAADAIGMPYGSYLHEVMDRAARRIDRKKIPRPNQLYSPKQVGYALEIRERARRQASLFGGEWDDRFFQQNPRLDPPRREALRLALSKMTGKATPEGVLSNLMGVQDALSQRMAKQMFRKQPELLESAMRSVSPPRVARPIKSLDPYLPPCLGLGQAVTLDPCNRCSFVSRCVRARAMSDKVLQAQTGSSDPRADKKREGARIRQSRKRERDRNALGEN
jgi:hypothetical protein